MQTRSLANIKLIILDRDGVINQDSAAYIRHPDDWTPIPGSIEALALLHQAGYEVVVATNQSGLGRGYYSLDTLNAIHAKMLACITAAGGKISHIFYCPHLPDANCDCRKPKPGLVLQALAATNTASELACFVGDSTRDIEAAIAAQVLPILVKTGNGAEALQAAGLDNIAVFDDLLAFSKALLQF